MSSTKRSLSRSNDGSPPRKRRSHGLTYGTDEIVPTFDGFQLIGDSQLLRFAEELLKETRITKDGLAYLGFCVSGQKIHDLLSRIQSRDIYKYVSNKVVLMIGTNDLLQNTKVERMCDGIRRVIDELLLECRVEKLIILTIPPVPRLRYEKDHWDRLNTYNEFVRSFGKENGRVHVIDAYTQFMKRPPSLSILHGTQKCDIKRRDESLTIEIDHHGGRRSFIKDEQNEKFRKMTPGKRKSTGSDNGKIIKRGRMRSSPTNEQNSDDSDDRDDRDNDADDHDDREGGVDDSILLDNEHKSIHQNLFEKNYYNGKTDEIHLNRDGLLVIRRLIRDYIDSIILK